MGFKFPFNFTNTTNNNNNNQFEFDPLRIIFAALTVSGVVRVILDSMTVKPDDFFYDQYLTIYVSSGKIFGYSLWALAIFLLVKFVSIKINKEN